MVIQYDRVKKSRENK